MSTALNNALVTLGTTPSTNSIYTNGNSPFHSKVIPRFKMEMYKSENGGFVMNLVIYKDNLYNEESKLYTLNDIENLGRDIQNILLVEILKN
jgi:hypothetical protein